MPLFSVVSSIHCSTKNHVFLQMFKVEDFIENHPEVFHRELASSAREIYNANYAEEIELNAKFRKFVTNYKAAYEGENTRRAQIINARNKRIKSDTERKLLESLQGWEV